MTNGNVTPPAPANYVNDDSVSIKAGVGMDSVQEPTQVETTDGVEEPTLKNDVEASDNPTGEAEGEAKHSSKTISELGEDRKRLAEQLIELARESEPAAEKLKELIANDSRIEKLIKTKFGEDYDSLVANKETAPESLSPEEVEKIKQQAKAEARYEAIMEEESKIKTKQLDLFAQSNALTTDEYETLKDYVRNLEGTKVAGQILGFEDALDAGLKLVNSDKANAGTQKAQMPAGGQVVNPPSNKTVEVTPELKAYGARVGRKAEDIARGLQSVNEKVGEDGVLRLSLD